MNPVLEHGLGMFAARQHGLSNAMLELSPARFSDLPSRMSQLDSDDDYSASLPEIPISGVFLDEVGGLLIPV